MSSRMLRVPVMKMKELVWISFLWFLLASSCQAEDPSPKAWPLQFHSQLYINTSGKLSVVDLWFDWPNDRNLNIIQSQLGRKLYDVEWDNGTSYFFDLDHKTCEIFHFPVGILRPNFLDNSQYLGVQELDGFSCNVWAKEDFITYYEDVKTQRPVGWLFFNGQSIHVITFEEGAVLSDEHWQAPSYCFTGEKESGGSIQSPLLPIFSKGSLFFSELWRRGLGDISSWVH